MYSTGIHLSEIPPINSSGTHTVPRPGLHMPQTITPTPTPVHTTLPTHGSKSGQATYRSSTLNVCPHQRLPMMSGPPMRLMINPTAIPTAHQSHGQGFALDRGVP